MYRAPGPCVEVWIYWDPWCCLGKGWSKRQQKASNKRVIFGPNPHYGTDVIVASLCTQTHRVILYSLYTWTGHKQNTWRWWSYFSLHVVFTNTDVCGLGGWRQTLTQMRAFIHMSQSRLGHLEAAKVYEGTGDFLGPDTRQSSVEPAWTLGFQCHVSDLHGTSPRTSWLYSHVPAV